MYFCLSPDISYCGEKIIANSKWHVNCKWFQIYIISLILSSQRGTNLQIVRGAAQNFCQTSSLGEQLRSLQFAQLQKKKKKKYQYSFIRISS